MVSNKINLALRAFQFLCTLIIMALIGSMIASAFSGNHSVVNYDMFVAVFAMLSLFYLILAAIRETFAKPMVIIVLDALNTLFFLCGAIATAAYLGAHSCSNDSYTLLNPITNSSSNRESRCRKAQAATAFLWFGFFAWLGTLVLSILGGKSSGSGIRRGPAMSQV